MKNSNLVMLVFVGVLLVSLLLVLATVFVCPIVRFRGLSGPRASSPVESCLVGMSGPRASSHIEVLKSEWPFWLTALWPGCHPFARFVGVGVLFVVLVFVFWNLVFGFLEFVVSFVVFGFLKFGVGDLFGFIAYGAVGLGATPSRNIAYGAVGLGATPFELSH